MPIAGRSTTHHPSAGSARNSPGPAIPSGINSTFRNLRNQKNLDPADHVNRVQRTEPHALSEVLSGDALRRDAQDPRSNRGEVARKRGTSEFSASGEALAIGADRFKRMILRRSTIFLRERSRSPTMGGRS